MQPTSARDSLSPQYTSLRAMNRIQKAQQPWQAVIIAIASLVGLVVGPTALRADNSDAVVVVEGKVEQVFSSPAQSRYDFLVHLNVLRSEVRRQAPAGVNVRFPAPGEQVYVHVSQLPGGRQPAANEPNVIDSKIPQPGSTIRAYLVPRSSGVWTGASSQWFDTTVAAPASATPSASSQPSPQGPVWEEATATSNLGMTTQAAQMEGKVVLKVTSVDPSGPARTAGLEVGDVIIGVNRAPLSNPNQLEQLATQQDELPIVVVDVNSGRTAQVSLKVDPNSVGSAPSSPGTAPEPEAPSLGISAEQVRVGFRTALKVLRVEPGTPAAEAGLEPGDLIVGANGAAITSPAQLGAALRKSGGTVTLTIRDVNTGKDVPVEVKLPNATVANPLPDSLPHLPTGGTSGSMGVVTELAFYNVEAAVRITEVVPGSPADRAGLTPGLIILQANGKPVLHPNELSELERSMGGQTVRLTVVDPNSGRKGTADVPL